MTDNSDAPTGSHELPPFGIVTELQSRAAATMQRAQRRLRSFFGFLSNDAAISRFVHEEQCRGNGEKLGGIKQTIRRISDSPYYSPSANSVAPYGYFCSRPVIGDCSPIGGGIYLSTRPAEALVVDEKYEALRIVLKDFRGKVSGVIGQNTLNDHQLLKFTMRYVRGLMKLDNEAVEDLNRELGGTADRKIALDSYINAGCGASRHLVLMTGFLLEGLKRFGMAVGNSSIDTSQTDERLIYTSMGGDLFIIDFTQAVPEAGH